MNRRFVIGKWLCVLALALLLLFVPSAPARADVVSVECAPIVPNGAAVSNTHSLSTWDYVSCNHPFTLTAPSRVVLTIANCSERSRARILTSRGEVVAESNSAYSSTSVETLLGPGSYYASAYREGSVSYDMTLTAVPIAGLTELEPNDTPAQAQPIQFAQAMHGAYLGLHDTDYYAFTLPADGRVVLRFAAKDGGALRCTLQLLTADEFVLLEADQVTAGSGYYEKTLDAGTYYVRLYSTDYNGLYSLMVTPFRAVQSVELQPKTSLLTLGEELHLRLVTTPEVVDETVVSWYNSSSKISKGYFRESDVPGLWVCANAVGEATFTVTMSGGKTASATISVALPALSGIKLPQQVRLTKGFSYPPMDVQLVPEKASMPSLKWQSSNPAVLRVNADNTVTGVANGTAVLTATASNNSAITSSCQVTVGDNVLQRTPQELRQLAEYLYDEDDAELVSCAKRMYYKGNYLHIEVYLYNQSGVKIKKSGKLKLAVYDWNISESSPIFTKSISWNPGTISDGKYKVYKTKLSVKRFKGRDLGSGQMEALVYGRFVQARSLTGKSLYFDSAPAFRLPPVRAIKTMRPPFARLPDRAP